MGGGGGGAPPDRNLSTELKGIYNAFGGQTTPAFNQFVQNQPLLQQATNFGLAASAPDISNQVLSTLRSGGALTPEQTHDVAQYTQAGFAQRGNLYGNQSLGAELLNRDAYRQQRFNTALQQASGLEGLAITPEQANVGSFATLTNPLYAYASDLYNTNYNAQAAANIAGQNKSSGLIGGGTSAIGAIGGGVAIAL